MKLLEISKQVLYYKVFIVSSYVVTSKINLAPPYCENTLNIPRKDFGETGLSEFCAIQRYTIV